MAEKYISLEGVDLANFTGVNEGNIDLIREHFGSQITLRGERLFIRGEDEEVARLETIFKELIFLQNRQGKISQGDVNLIIDLVSEQKDGELDKKTGIKSADLDDVILVTKSSVVKPRSVGQKEF